MFVTEHSGANSLQFIYTHQEQKQQMPGYTLYLGMPSTQNSHKLESLTKSQTKKKIVIKSPQGLLSIHSLKDLYTLLISSECCCESKHP